MPVDAVPQDVRSRRRLYGVLIFVGLISIPWIIQFIVQLRREIYVPTEDAVIAKMFELAKVTKDDVVFDLGCGDGRIIIEAAKKFGCQGVGVEFNPTRIAEARVLLAKSGVNKDLVDIRLGDAFKVPDLERATVVTLYVLPAFMAELEPQIKTRLKPGTRVVAHDYWFPNIERDQFVEVDVGGPRPKYLYMWTVREAKKK